LGGPEELACEQQRRKQNADAEGAVRDPQSVDEENCRERHVADEDEPRIEDSEQLDDPAVRVAVILDELAELLLVALLLAERLDRADTGHRLDEVHDELRRCRARLAEVLLRARLEPAGQEVERHERREQHEPADPVEHEERARDEHHVEDPRHELAHAGVEQLANRVEVARLARDDSAGCVALVELHAQPLGVQEHALAQVEQDGLADPRREDRVPRDEPGADAARHEVRDNDEDDRRPVGVVHERRETLVDAGRDKQRPCHLRGGAHHDDGHRQYDLRPHRLQERTQKPDAASANLSALRLVEVAAVFTLYTGDTHASSSCSSARCFSSRASSSSRLEMTKR
jgi:hypothetical protein